MAVRWTIRVDKFSNHEYHWVVTRSTDDSRYQKDGDESSHGLAMAAALDEISLFERLNEPTRR